MLDGFGAFISPPPTARPVPTDFAAVPAADHPPGLYGPPEGFCALNLLATNRPLPAARFQPARQCHQKSIPRPRRWICADRFFLAALALFLLDGLVVLFLSGGIRRLSPRRSRAAAAMVAVLALLALTSVQARAQEPADSRCRPRRSQTSSPMSSPATPTSTRSAKPDCRAHAVPGAAHGARGRRPDRHRPRAGRACVLSADLLADRAGRAAARRTTALKRIDAYMKQGGTVLFDTRDALDAPPAGGETRSPGMPSCARFCPRSTSRRSSRCRATTC